MKDERFTTRSEPPNDLLRPPTRGYVRKVLRTCGVAEHDLEDATQRVLLTALRKRRQIRAGSEAAFLRAVATREASHARRARARRREVYLGELESETGSTESVRPDWLTVRKSRASTVEQLLASMHPELRRVLTLVELEGHALNEAAQILGIPLGTCKSRLRRARAHLSSQIDELPESVRALLRS